MKKRLEAELISIAHRILKLKNKSEVDQLYLETRKLYEALTVLKFYGDNYEQIKSEISKEELDKKVADLLEEKTPVVIEIKSEPIVETVTVEEAPKEIVDETKAEEIVIEVTKSEESTEAIEQEPNEEPIIVGEILIEEDEIEDVNAKPQETLSFEPIFENENEEVVEEAKKDEITLDKVIKAQQISLEDLLGSNYSDLEFVKPSEVKETTTKNTEEFNKNVVSKDKKEDEFFIEKPTILNEKLASTINIGLNDRVGFVKYLFANSNEDFNRVLSQLNTFDSFKDAKSFISDMVKPDYNNWKGQEDFEYRFMELVERKFL